VCAGDGWRSSSARTGRGTRVGAAGASGDWQRGAWPSQEGPWAGLGARRRLGEGAAGRGARGRPVRRRRARVWEVGHALQGGRRGDGPRLRLGWGKGRARWASARGWPDGPGRPSDLGGEEGSEVGQLGNWASFSPLLVLSLFFT
jgi:hypothetical protein